MSAVFNKKSEICSIILSAGISLSAASAAKAQAPSAAPPAAATGLIQPVAPHIGRTEAGAANPAPAQQKAELTLTARLTKDGQTIQRGMQWRIYNAGLNLDNSMKLVAQSSNGQAKFTLPAGDYIIIAAFGRATQILNITMEAGEVNSADFDLEAGGVKLSASLPEGKINETQLHFTIYPGDSESEQKPLISNIKSGEIIRLPAGPYHIVCEYGNANAITRSNIRIEAGKLTEAVMQQQAAQIILKLVRQKGGEALADTNWAIMNDAGDIVREIANANAYIILQEGDYVAVARNKDQIYQKEFAVVAGKDAEIEVSATAQNSVDEDGID